MHARELVHLAAVVATHGAGLVQGDAKVSAGSLQRYWAASKCRLDRWQRGLKLFSASSARAAVHRRQWKTIRPIVEEILLSEVLARVWAALLVAYDRSHRQYEAEPIARSVLTGQLEARRRALGLMLNAPGVLLEDAVSLNRLRRKTERWTDLLLARLVPLGEISEFAAEPARAHSFAEDLRQDAAAGHTCQAWTLLLASLHVSFQSQRQGRSPNADLNERIAASVLACFPSELFDSTGLLQSLWMARMRYAPDDAQLMLDELWSMERS